MKSANRPFKTFKLNHPIVYETGETTQEITEFKIYKPLGGQLKKVDWRRMNTEDLFKISELCSDITMAELDLLELEDIMRLDVAMAGFFSLGSKDSQTKKASSTPENSKQTS